LAVPTATAPIAVSIPAAAAEPAPAEQGGTQPSSTGENATTNGARPVEIEIEGREFKTELNPAHSHDRHVRLRNRSDQFVVVDVEDEEVSRPLPPDGEMLIGLDIFSTSGFKVELRRNNGVLVLRLHDWACCLSPNQRSGGGTVFLDAFVIRSLLLPAVLELLDRSTWKFPDRLGRRTSDREAAHVWVGG
jgi:hypothetical protein